MEVVAGLRIPCVPAGSTTFRRRAKRGGVEGDQTFYFANEAKVRGKEALRLKVDPPPDLAIEVVISHDADDAVEVYRRFGVPEVWICEASRLTILCLEASGRYAKSERSRVLPVLTASEIHAWASRQNDESDTAWIKDLRRWVREVLAPRHRELKQHVATETDKSSKLAS